MDAQKVKERLVEVIMHCELSETPPEYEDGLAHICAEAKEVDLTVTRDGALGRLGVSAVVAEATNRQVVAIEDGGWSVEIR